MYFVWFGNRADDAADSCRDVAAGHFLITMCTIVDDKSVDALSFHIMRIPYHSTFHHAGMHVDGILHFGGTDAVSADVQHVINAARNPVETIVIPVGSITREIKVLIGGKIIGPAAFMVAISGPEGSRPG